MKMMKQENPVKFIMMMLQSIGKYYRKRLFSWLTAFKCMCPTFLFMLLVFFVDRLLDRDQAGDDDALLEDEDEDGFLKAFKVYIL